MGEYHVILHPPNLINYCCNVHTTGADEFTGINDGSLVLGCKENMNVSLEEIFYSNYFDKK
jgi:hypothetical protein